MATLENVGPQVERSEKVIAGGSVLEMIAGAAAVVLPILALVGVYPTFLAAIAFIAIGGALMSQGGGMSVRSRSLIPAAAARDAEAVGAVGGMSAAILGGAAVVVLGILALVGVVPLTMLACAAIVGGGALVLAAGTTSRLASYRYGAAARLDDTQREILRESVNASAGADVLAGLAGIVLGILTLANVGPVHVMLTLSVVAALALGAALFLTGTTVGARMAALLSS